ncbi:MAG: DUF883 family protein [Panacagrimonas sp.]
MSDDDNTLHSPDSTSARDRFVTDLQTLSSHAQDLLQVTSMVSGEGVAAAREQLQDSVRMAGETLRRFQTDAMDRGRKAALQADTYVRENPWQSIAVGVAAGLVIGLATSSMTRGSRN